ncbi:hypothetical protein OH77DRAFT_120285 [Trametes cingulata]|nr:hypothetical protein OH77DRAFT_120285 [Trametes cingulata]
MTNSKRRKISHQGPEEPFRMKLVLVDPRPESAATSRAAKPARLQGKSSMPNPGSASTRRSQRASHVVGDMLPRRCDIPQRGPNAGVNGGVQSSGPSQDPDRSSNEHRLPDEQECSQFLQAICPTAGRALPGLRLGGVSDKRSFGDFLTAKGDVQQELLEYLRRDQAITPFQAILLRHGLEAERNKQNKQNEPNKP